MSSKTENIMKKKEIIYLVLFLLILAFGYYRNKQKIYTFKKGKIIFNTYVEIEVESQKKGFNIVLDSIFDQMSSFDSIFSYHNQKSVLSSLNKSSQFVLPKDMLTLLEYSQELYYISDSLFDVTIGALTDLWDIHKAKIPKIKQIKNAKKNVGFFKLKLFKDTLKKPKDLKINLGAISKGFIVDKIIRILKEKNAISGYINAGGDIKSFGGKTYKIGIRNPRDGSKIVKKINVKNKAVVTSGDYERFFDIGDIRYHHIINPKSGYPDSDIIATTVIGDEAFKVDGISTMLFLMGKKRAITYLDSLTDYAAIIFYLDNKKVKYKRSPKFIEYEVK